VLYIHGGGYISNIIRQQWNLIEDLITKTNSTIIIPDYKLAPEATYKETYEFILNVYNQILKNHNAEDLIIMGDSAGGGFALGFAMTLRDNNQTQPSQSILLSPWLDISMQNPEIQKVDKYDKMLSIDGLQMAGKLFAGNLDIKDYRVSPIYGDFKNLNKITVFIGTHDLFIADTRKMKATLDSLNIPFNYFEYPKMKLKNPAAN
jgi:acetyl esterase/lipase